SVRRLFLGRAGKGDRIPAALYTPAGKSDTVVLVVHPEGRAGLLKDGKPGPLLDGILRGGRAVLAVDAFLTGDHGSSRITNTGHFLTYNHSTLAERVQDVLTALAYLRMRPNSGEAE